MPRGRLVQPVHTDEHETVGAQQVQLSFEREVREHELAQATKQLVSLARAAGAGQGDSRLDERRRVRLDERLSRPGVDRLMLDRSSRCITNEAILVG